MRSALFCLWIASLSGVYGFGCQRDAAGADDAAVAEAAPEPAPGAVAAASGAPVDWCAGHGLPESKCTVCNPELAADFQAEGDWCPEHGFPESACPVCNPQPPPAEVSAAGPRVIFKADDHEDTVGIETALARATTRAATLDVPARVGFAESGVADVRALVPGLVREVRVEVGDEVAAGDVLFVLESAAVSRDQGDAGASRARVAAARTQVERQRELFDLGAVSRRKLEVAERDLAEAKAALSAARAGLDAAGASGRGELAVTAPIAGTITARPGLLGTLATAETSLATVVDTSEMWLWLEVPADDAAALALGQTLAVRVDGVTGPRLESQIAWVAPEVDVLTRAVRVRAHLDNADARLRANQFARARIALGPPGDAVEVPVAAVQRVGEGHVVFVREALGQYAPRQVTPGAETAGWLAVEGELAIGDAVVTTGAYVLKTELSPDAIGAGCCEAE